MTRRRTPRSLLESLSLRTLELIATARAKSLVDSVELTGPPVPIRTLARKKRVTRLIERPLEQDALLLCYQDHYLVAVDSRTTRTRRSFSIAHELGHVLMLESTLAGGHAWLADPSAWPMKVECRGSARPLAISSSSSSLLEDICDRLAGELLMPKKFFLPRARELEPSIASLRVLATQFDVSPQAVVLRLAEFALWDAIAIVWRLKDRPGSGWRKLRVDWSAALNGTGCFIPRHKPADPTSTAAQTFATDSTTASRFERMHLGSLRGWYWTESACFIGRSNVKFVLTVVRTDGVPGMSTPQQLRLPSLPAN
jgi:Zn-dependent peptidase ImmA (M78 family)